MSRRTTSEKINKMIFVLKKWVSPVGKSISFILHTAERHNLTDKPDRPDQTLRNKRRHGSWLIIKFNFPSLHHVWRAKQMAKNLTKRWLVKSYDTHGTSDSIPLFLLLCTKNRRCSPESPYAAPDCFVLCLFCGPCTDNLVLLLYSIFYIYIHIYIYVGICCVNDDFPDGSTRWCSIGWFRLPLLLAKGWLWSYIYRAKWNQGGEPRTRVTDSWFYGKFISAECRNLVFIWYEY